jgi:NAD(P)H-dependent FMN reductase
MFIPIILGTARQGRQSEKVAKLALSEANNFGFESELIDVKDFRIEATDNTKNSDVAKKLLEKISKAGGLIIVTPEYNHGYPGELKMFLDMLYQEYFNKPVGFCGVSAGPLGGARAVEQLRQVVVELHMIPVREAIYFPLVQNAFDEGGDIKDVSYKERFKLFFTEIKWYADNLKNNKNYGN